MPLLVELREPRSRLDELLRPMFTRYLPSAPAECSTCAGTGYWTCSNCHGSGGIHDAPCEWCGGRGVAGECSACNGTGLAPVAPLGEP